MAWSSIFCPSRWSRRLTLFVIASLAIVTLIAVGIGWDSYHLREGRGRAALGDSEGAVDQLRLCMGIWAGRFDRHLLAAQVARLRQDFEEAEAELDACERLRPQAETLADERLALRAAEGDVEMAKQRAWVLGQTHPSSAAALQNAVAAGYILNGDVPQAYVNAEEALRYVPDHPEAAYHRGHARQLMGKLDGALADYRLAAAGLPRRQDIRLRLAQLLSQLGHPLEAITYLEELRQELPHDPDILLTLARLRLDEAEADEAQRLLQQLLSHHRDHPGALWELATLALRQKQPTEAQGYLRRLIARVPGHLDGHVLLAQLASEAGNPEEAQKLREWIAKLDREVIRVNRLIDRATTLVAGTESPSAEPFTASPAFASLGRDVAVGLTAQGRDEEAMLWLHRALAADPKNAATHRLLADGYQRLGDPGRARWHAKRAQAPVGES